MTNWTDNGPCKKGKSKIKADYDRYLPVKGGHVVDSEEYPFPDELDEIDDGTQLGVNPCVNCGKYVGLVVGYDHYDNEYYIPTDPDIWNHLNGIKGKR